ncbi:MAG: transglutaminase domain-containing protein [Pseudomonadota bacterium]
MPNAPLLLGAAVIFWGWRVGQLELAIPMSVLLEGARFVRWRWRLDDRDFNRLADLSAIILLGIVVYHVDQHSVQAIFPIIEWVPFALFPVVFALNFSTSREIKTSSLFLSVRRAVARGEITQVRSINLVFPYFLICLLAASASRGVRVEYFLILSGFAFWALWAYRPRHAKFAVWLSAMAVALGVGFATERGLLEVRRAIEPWVVEWFQSSLWKNRDLFRAQTAIGHIGRLKLSERIVFRVVPARGHPPPALLRDGVYRGFSRNVWLSRARAFNTIDPSQDGTNWDLHPYTGPERRANISQHLNRGRALLAIPNGTFRLEELNVERLQVNALGTLKANTGPDLITYTARYQQAEELAPPPDSQDTTVPVDHAVLFRDLVERLALDGLADREKVARIEGFFGDGFRYTLVQTPRGIMASRNALRRFLEDTRAGHCEYFATATALALRATGIPARYVTGYAVAEWSPLEGAFVVRKRHAHAWVSAFVEGRWVTIDTTPSLWVDAENDERAWWASIYNVASWLGFAFDEWRYTESDTEILTQLGLGLAALLALVLGWRLVRTTELVQVERSSRSAASPIMTTLSPFSGLEQTLTEAGFPRRSSETPRQYVARLARLGVDGANQLGAMVDDHYILRFGPQSARRADAVRRIDAEAKNWLSHYGDALIAHRGAKSGD